jgi:Protein of unknown function (DUF3298)
MTPRNAALRAPLLAVLLSLVPPSCGGTIPSQLANAPVFDPRGQSTCSVNKNRAKPLIVEWPAADRGSLEARLKQGIVAVRYEGCTMEVLDRCRGPGAYTYSGVTRKDDTITMRDADDLYANIPVHALSFEAKLQSSGELNVAMTIVGRYAADRATVRSYELQGDCSRATHVIAALTTGAFEFFAGSDAAIGGEVRVASIGAEAQSTAKRETLTRDGDRGMCAKATTKDTGPPEGCGALLRVEVVPLGGFGRPTPTRKKFTGEGPAKVTIDYVSFTLDDARIASELNAHVERAAFAGSDDYVGSKGEPDWFFEKTCDVVHLAPEGVSILCTTDKHSGGAHPAHGASSLVFVWAEGRLREVTLADLFLPGSGWEKLLASQYTEALHARGASRALDGSFAITPGELDAWTVDPDGLTIYFDPYSAGSYAEGTYSVVLQWSNLSAIANINGPLRTLRERAVSGGS